MGHAIEAKFVDSGSTTCAGITGMPLELARTVPVSKVPAVHKAYANTSLVNKLSVKISYP